MYTLEYKKINFQFKSINNNSCASKDSIVLVKKKKKNQKIWEKV